MTKFTWKTKNDNHSWQTKDCNCRWCQWRNWRKRSGVGHILALQIYRRATERLAKVFRQVDEHLRVRRKEGDALLTLRDFMQACFKWGSFLEYINITGTCFGDNYQMRRLVLKMIGLMDGLNEYPEGSDYKIASAICGRGVEINAQIAPLLSRHRRQIADGEKIELTILKKNMGKLIQLRNTWTNAEHRYFDDEVPQFGLNCAQEKNSGILLYFDEADITNEPLDLLARIAASRLIRMYDKLLMIIERLGGQDIFVRQIQARMDFGCQMVDRCLYGGQETKNDDAERSTRESGQSGSGLEQEPTESTDAGARERGAA